MPKLSVNDTVKAYLTTGKGVICSLYDSGFSSLDAVFSALCRKVPQYAGIRVWFHVETESQKYFKFCRKTIPEPQFIDRFHTYSGRQGEKRPYGQNRATATLIRTL
jgi:hypothetical protein